MTIRPADIGPLFALMEGNGLRSPEVYKDRRVLTMNLEFYAQELNAAGVTLAEATEAAAAYLRVPDRDGYPKPWPAVGHLLAHTPIGRARAFLGSEDDGERAWADFDRRMGELGYVREDGQGPRRGRPALECDPDPYRNDAMWAGLAGMGGYDAWRYMNPADPTKQKRAFVTAYRKARDGQQMDPEAVKATRALLDKPRLRSLPGGAGVPAVRS